MAQVINVDLLGSGNQLRNTCAVITFSTGFHYVGEIMNGLPAYNGRIYYDNDDNGYYRVSQIKSTKLNTFAYVKTCGCTLQLLEEKLCSVECKGICYYLVGEKAYQAHDNLHYIENIYSCQSKGKIIYTDTTRDWRTYLYQGQIKCFQRVEENSRTQEISSVIPLIQQGNPVPAEHGLSPEDIKLIESYCSGKFMTAVDPRISECLTAFSSISWNNTHGPITIEFKNGSQYNGYEIGGKITGIGQYYEDKSNNKVYYLLPYSGHVKTKIIRSDINMHGFKSGKDFAIWLSTRTDGHLIQAINGYKVKRDISAFPTSLLEATEVTRIKLRRENGDKQVDLAIPVVSNGPTLLSSSLSSPTLLISTVPEEVNENGKRQFEEDSSGSSKSNKAGNASIVCIACGDNMRLNCATLYCGDCIKKRSCDCAENTDAQKDKYKCPKCRDVKCPDGISERTCETHTLNKCRHGLSFARCSDCGVSLSEMMKRI